MASATTPDKANAVKTGPRDDASGGFFAPHKPGQGFWTRLGTGVAAGLIILFTVQFAYRRIPAWTSLTRDDWALYAIVAGIAIVLAGLTWWLINRPRHADFLINTDGEMKKVSWPTWRELIGSTKVVVGFMFLMAALLFTYDIVFGTVMWAVNVLKIPPFFVNS